MATTANIAVVQLEWKRYQTVHQFRQDLHHKLKFARSQRAQAVLFPELTGLMLAAPIAQEKKEGSQKKGILNRLREVFSSSDDIDDLILTLLNEHGDELVERYVELFSELARDYSMLIVGGSLLAPDEQGIMGYRTGVFDAAGELLGWQMKLHLSAEEKYFTEPGDELKVFEAPFGRFGVLIGHDIFFPELARALAYRGCVGIFNPTLAHSGNIWQQQRLLANARAQENQLFIAQSFLVGDDGLFTDHPGPFLGGSAILAPFELSSNKDGIQKEVKSEKKEEVISEMWDIQRLHQLWQDAEMLVREMARSQLYHDLLIFDYQSGATITEWTNEAEQIAELLQGPIGDEAASLLAQLNEQGIVSGKLRPSGFATEGLFTEQSTTPSPTYRYEPMIEPGTGYYLGEQRVEIKR